ncbi:MAG: hypothetical protein U0359_22905 [Byssovorax sp.]
MPPASLAEPLPARPADAAPAARSPRRAAIVEWLLTGGLTLLLFPLSWLLRRALGLDAAELAVGFTMFHAAYIVNDPHFSVTYLLFYADVRDRALGSAFSPLQRARYVIAGFIAPPLLLAWAALALALKSAVILGYLIQLMFLLVGWHYVKQGFGALSVLAARRGVAILPRERTALLLHAFAGWGYAWSTKPGVGKELEEKGVVFTKLPYPPGLERLSLVLLLGSLGWILWLLVARFRREGRLPLLTPLTAYVMSIWAWSIWSGIDPLLRYMVPALHSLQYLYFVRLLAANEAREREGPPFFEAGARARMGLLAAGALALGFMLFHGAPTLLDDALVEKRDRFTDLGPTPYFAALYACVNIHHYLMDHVIWRRENPKTRYLRAMSATSPLPTES